MIRRLTYDPLTSSTSETGATVTLDKPGGAGGVVWIDLVDPTREELAEVGSAFDLNPIAIDASVEELKYPSPKTEVYGHSTYIRWYCIDSAGGALERLSIFVSADHLITIGQRKIAIVAELFEVAGDKDLLKEGSDWLLIRLLGAMADSFSSVLNDLSDRADKLEDEMFEKPTKAQLRELFDHKHHLLELHRILSPQRETISILTRFDKEIVGSDIYPYYLDIRDRLVQMSEAIDITRDVVNGAMDIYLSSISNRLNEVMRRLTIVATIFMPLTLITGIFGMNLSIITENAGNVVPLILGIVVSLIVIAAVIIGGRY